MAMNAAAMGAAIKAQLVTDGLAVDDASVTDVWTSVSTAIIAHMTTNAVVSTTGLPTLSVQVTPATGTGATTVPDTTTGTIA
ncbi:MAG: hypothetical protein OEM38_00520 [Gammaproteobacteria bacterium]|nr:hypothetical protein [Gammaproteobacteria bacterium]